MLSSKEGKTVGGLVRLVALDASLVLFDLTTDDPIKAAYIHECGDLSSPPVSLGPILRSLEPSSNTLTGNLFQVIFLPCARW